ncbi:MAG: hypothetical protein LBC75_06040 [Fibromonadaceae bacterium]|jgi:hypothetical protein|nr:hypothetical protein [Fibromonadaceae bacterium]
MTKVSIILIKEIMFKSLFLFIIRNAKMLTCEQGGIVRVVEQRHFEKERNEQGEN